MHFLLPLASLLGLEVEELKGRLQRQAIAWGTISGLCLIAGVFMLVALNSAATTWLGPIWGPLSIAGGALLIALVVVAGLRITAALAAREKAERRQAVERSALVTGAAITGLPMLLRSPLMRRIGLPVGGALAALYLLRKPGGYKPD